MRMLATGDRALYDECRARVEAGVAALPDKPEETPEATVAALWHAAAGAPLSAAAAISAPLPSLDREAGARLRGLLARRLAGEPLAHLTGRARFMGLEMLAGPAALIPRRETELLATAALAKLKDVCDAGSGGRALDACTGCGNVALALAHHEPRARIHGADISPEAVDLARHNARSLGLADRAAFECGDLLAPFAGSEFAAGGVDLVTCNPPYISSGRLATLPAEIAEHEPRLAFDGGPLGIRILERLVREAHALLRGGGWLAFEVGAGQGPGVRKRVERHGGYEAVQEVADAAGVVRALVARRRES